MVYSVKEIFLTLQGEGAQAGIAAIFLRFAGCNLWTGLARDRASAICKFCDTDFIGTDGVNGGKFTTARDLARAVNALWPQAQEQKRGQRHGQRHGQNQGQKWVVCTGGEPLLQLDRALIAALHQCGFKIAVETNGTIKAPLGIDWLCVSPKARAPLQQKSGHELKLVYPQAENHPDDFADLDFQIFSLQPRDDRPLNNAKNDNKKGNDENMRAVIAYCLAHPQWRISLQSHKIMDIP